MDNANESQSTPPVNSPNYRPYTTYYRPVRPPVTPFPTGNKELSFAVMLLITSLLLCNFIIFGGFNLGFAISINLCVLSTVVYLLRSGCRPTPYSTILLLLSFAISTGFARSGDGFVKFVMLCFLFISINLGLCLLAGQPLFHPGRVLSLCDAYYTAFYHSMGKFPPAFLGLKEGLSGQGSKYRKGGAILLGLLVAMPIAVIMVILLTRADAAFEGLIKLLPELNEVEIPVTLILGIALSCSLYCRGVSLRHSQKPKPFTVKFKGISSLTVNTVLGVVCFVYLVYLISQLAYFTGGFAGILPQGYTMAQYARRGFFEMALLCAINLGLIALCVGLVRRSPRIPLSTRLLCLFITVITVFFVVTASGKMFLYIKAYGLTRLRVLTQVIMLWICLTNVLVALWLLYPRLPYMKIVVTAALVIGAAVLWADVDTIVAHYNVDRYLSSSMEQIDTDYLTSLNLSAAPHIARLAESAPDEQVRQQAQAYLDNNCISYIKDFRQWNYVRYTAQEYLPDASSQPDDMNWEVGTTQED